MACFRNFNFMAIAGSIFALVSGCGGATRNGAGGTGGSPGADAGAGGSGGAGTSLDVRDFDQSCEETADCYPVRDGNQCLCGLCPTAAINNNAVSVWVARSKALECPGMDCSHSIVCDDKAYGCRENRCVVVEAPDVAPAHYDRTCREDDDCVTISIGEWCTSCDCNPPGAVSNAGYARWAAEVSDLSCTRPEKDCGCRRPPQYQAVCVHASSSVTGECGTRQVELQ